ncbi:hypothetical protein [Acidipropionibacterium virtanenii]|uniref:Uncharacterized protein n=1 Tax=Acidipropionibacterium virtanenii TaxID=2057246 RepID=A0A344UPT1_9ACTN|nr:hypothetical protein [Acidipropionibacterium virtanenii]AXE37279.1 hypothetical protein JS278_00081 [Acidipropionibacterium virtanenii]
MAILLLTSASGAPGVTTTALGLALCWPRDVLMVDADPHPSHAVESGYLSAGTETGGGLADLAGAHRAGTDLTAALWNQVIALPGIDGRPSPTARFLPGFGHPAQPALFTMIWPAIAASLAELGDAGVDVIVDLGRMGSDGLPAELCARAGAVGVVTRCGLRPLAGLSVNAETVEAVSSRTAATVGLVTVGAGHPYSAREICAQFGMPVIAEVADDPRAAAVLSDGAPGPRGWASGRYASGLRHSAARLAGLLADAAREVAL